MSLRSGSLSFVLRFVGLALCGALALAFLGIGSARAESVAILNLRAQDGDDELANVMSSLLRRSATQVPDWTIIAGDRGLDQLMLVNACESANDECIARIGTALRVGRLLYGTLSRSEGMFEVVIHSFNVAAGTVDGVASERFTERQTDVDDLRGPARRMMISLSEQHVVVTPAPAPVAPPPDPNALDPRLVERWVGIGALSVGAVFLAATVYSWVRIPQIPDDPAFDAYRSRFPPSVSDVCESAATGAPGDGDGSRATGIALANRVDGLCREADRLDVLQFVFLGLSAAGLGAGSYFLVRSFRDDHDGAPEQALSFRPALSRNGFSLDAEWRF